MAKALQPTAAFNRWIEQALAECAHIKADFTRMKLRALKAGYFFLQARDSVKEGDFADLLRCFHERVSATTAYRYMQFTDDVLLWTREEYPAVKNSEELLKLAGAMILQSPKSFIALMRQLGEMRKFGEYDEIKYKTRKIGTGAQLELNFAATWSVLDTLDRIDALTWAELPEGKTDQDVLVELDAKLGAIHAKVRAQLEGSKAIDL